MALRTPEFINSQTYTGLRARQAFSHAGLVQPGVWNVLGRGLGDFAVQQRAAGANMSVDVLGGFAWVKATDAGNRGMYHIENDATINQAVTASNATLPRVDQVYVVINDSIDGGDLTDTPAIGVAAGTPTTGATLDNRTGVTALPNSSLLLADVLVPAASASVTSTNIRDRRPWARGSQTFDFTLQSSIDIPVDSLTDRLVMVEGEVMSSTFNANLLLRPNGNTGSGRNYITFTSGSNTGAATGPTALAQSDTGMIVARAANGAATGQTYWTFSSIQNLRFPSDAPTMVTHRSQFNALNTAESSNQEIDFGFAVCKRSAAARHFSMVLAPTSGTITGTIRVTRLGLMNAS